MKRYVVRGARAVLIFLAACLLASCGSTDSPTEQQVLVGIAMPEESSECATAAFGQALSALLMEAGVTVDLQYAGSVPENQNTQIGVMVMNKARALVCVPVDESVLEESLTAARAADIPVYIPTGEELESAPDQAAQAMFRQLTEDGRLLSAEEYAAAGK